MLTHHPLPPCRAFILCAAIAGLSGASCRKVRDAVKGSNKVALPTHEPTGWTVSGVRMTPIAVTTRNGERPSHTLSLTVSGPTPAANERIAVRAACLRRGRVWASGWLKRAVSMGKEDKIPFSFLIREGERTETCELEFAHFKQTSSGSGKVSSIGTACLHHGEMKVGNCSGKELPRTAPGSTPDIAELNLDASPNNGRVSPPPGKPAPKFLVSGSFLLQRSTKPPGKTGISLEAHCETPKGIEKRFIGYPSQSSDLKPGEWLHESSISWSFDDMPTRCELNWAFGKGSLLPSEDPPREAPFAQRCWDGKKVSKGPCSPAMTPSAKAAQAAPSASAAPSTSAAASAAPSASASAAPSAR